MSNGLKPLYAAIAEPLRYAIEPKVDGVRGLVVYERHGRRGSRESFSRTAARSTAMLAGGVVEGQGPELDRTRGVALRPAEGGRATRWPARAGRRDDEAPVSWMPDGSDALINRVDDDG